MNNILLCIYTTFVYPFIQWWTLGLFPLFGYCEWCCCEHRCTNIHSSPCFNAEDIQLLGNGIAGLMVILCLIFWGTTKLFSMGASIHFSYYLSIPPLVTQLVSGCHPRAGMVLGSGDSRGTCRWRHIGTANSMKNINAQRGLPPCLSQYIFPPTSSYQLLWFSTNLMTSPRVHLSQHSSKITPHTCRLREVPSRLAWFPPFDLP